MFFDTMDSFDPFLLGNLTFRYRAAVWVDKYVIFLLHNKLGKFSAAVYYSIFVILFNTTLGEKFLQVKQSYHGSLKIASLVFLCRVMQARFPIIDDLLWLLNLQGLSKICSLDNLFGSYSIEDGDKASEILGYISSLINLSQFFVKMKSIPKLQIFIQPPFKSCSKFECSQCKMPLVDTGRLNQNGALYCFTCNDEDRIIYL
eukprot:NODE_4_length_77007_cov_1.156642.p54 type:complete len:202 gc:universal NODE_4_length_77007_cov_1.156642:7641-7036(-)